MARLGCGPDLRQPRGCVRCGRFFAVRCAENNLSYSQVLVLSRSFASLVHLAYRWEVTDKSVQHSGARRTIFPSPQV